MALYAIGDLHLCLGAPKPMDIFGGAWVGYMDKLRDGLSVIRPEDTTVLLGDLSWALDLSGAKADFAWINAIPGRKIILKGNHDYWWSTAAKFQRFCQENGFENLNLLNNNCYEYEGVAICGTRGWFYEEDRSGEHDEKVFKRELLRLEASLKAAGICGRWFSSTIRHGTVDTNVRKFCSFWKIRRQPLLLRPSPRGKSRPCHGRTVGRCGFPAGRGGLYRIPALQGHSVAQLFKTFFIKVWTFPSFSDRIYRLYNYK